MPEKLFYPSLDGTRLCALVHDVAAARGTVVLAHGITVDKDESGDTVSGVGAFVELAAHLERAGFNVLRFDFRGHGESAGRQQDMTISGELLDLLASLDVARRRWRLPLALLGASFGAVSAALYAAHAGADDLACLVLWNPVLDLRRTFLEPALSKPAAFFNDEGYASLEQRGFLLLDQFRVGRCLVEEMRRVEPFAHMARIACPVLTLHGQRDEYVPFDVAQLHALCNPQSRFVPLPQAGHGFTEPADRQLVIPETLRWLDLHLAPA